MGEMNSKAIFFSIVSVLIIVLFIAFVELSSSYEVGQTDLELTRKRVNIINSLITDMEDTYFEKIVYVSTKNSLIGLSNYYSNGQFSPDRLQKFLEFALLDVIYNGTLRTNGGSVNLSPQYMDYNYTIDGLTGQLSDVLGDLGLEVNELSIDISKGSLKQTNPWELQLEANIAYDLRDKTGIASWKGTTTKTVDISVYGLYAFDYENGKSNFGVITDSWQLDNSPYSEPSTLDKLSKHTATPDPGLGICSPGFSSGGNSCKNDTGV